MTLPGQQKNGAAFLKDANIIRTICNDHASRASRYHRSRFRPGILTSSLANHHKPLVCIEKDDRMREYLDNILPWINS